jgi:archaellum biogenesis ATPase FlaH
VIYVEIAVDSPRNRGTLVLKSDLHTYIPVDGKALYRSVYLYNEEAKQFADSKGTLKGYHGERGIDNVLIDIDKKDNSNEYTLKKLRDNLEHLKILEVPEESLQCFFSGTGYHIVITNKIFNFQPSDSLPYQVKQTMSNLFDNIDTSIYMRSGIYRVPHTKNQKTGLYKIPLTLREAYHSTVEEIHNLASDPRFEYPYEVLDGDSELEGYICLEIPKIAQFGNVMEPTKVVPCVQTMLRNGPQEGSRHNTALRIASHFKRHGIPSEYAKVALLHWNDNTLDEQQMIEKTESVYNGNYNYGCQDVLMKKYCQTKCIYFKNKDYHISVKNSDEMQKDFEERLETNFQGRTIPLAEMFGLDEFDTKIYPGELVTIFGPTGANKTTLAQNLALGVDFKNDLINKEWQIPTLFLSLELSAWYMHRRHLQIVSGLSKEEVNEDYKNIYKKHADELRHLHIQTVSPTLNSIQDKIKELNPSVVIVDYIDLVETPRDVKGEYEQVKFVSHSLSNMAVNLDLIIIQISQVSREYSRNDILDLYAGKGSGAIENASRKVIGLNGQANTNVKHINMYKNTDGELFDVEVEWRNSFRLRRV